MLTRSVTKRFVSVLVTRSFRLTEWLSSVESHNDYAAERTRELPHPRWVCDEQGEWACHWKISRDLADKKCWPHDIDGCRWLCVSWSPRDLARWEQPQACPCRSLQQLLKTSWSWGQQTLDNGLRCSVYCTRWDIFSLQRLRLISRRNRWVWFMISAKEFELTPKNGTKLSRSR